MTERYFVIHVQRPPGDGIHYYYACLDNYGVPQYITEHEQARRVGTLLDADDIIRMLSISWPEDGTEPDIFGMTPQEDGTILVDAISYKASARVASGILGRASDA